MQLAKVTLASNFSMVLTKSREGILALDKNGDIIAFNERAEELLTTKIIALGENIFSDHFVFYTPEEFQALPLEEIPFYATLHYNIDQEDVTLGIKQSTSHYRWLSFSSKWIRDVPTPYMLVSFFDISKTVELNIVLRAKERQLRLLVSSLNDMVFEVTREGQFINYWTNDEDLLFYSPSDFLGKTIHQLFPPAIADQSIHLVKETLRTGVEQEMDFLSPIESHKNHWYHVQVKPIHLSADRVALVISDITTEVENKEKIKLNENKFNQAFHFSGLGMSITGLDGYCLDANRTLCQMLGYTKNELQSIRLFDVTHPEDLSTDLELRKKLLDNEIESFTLEKRYQHKSGDYIWCDTTVSLVRNHKHHPQFYIAQIQNISQAKQNIEILQSQKTELEFIKIDLETKVRQLEEFNQIVAHNLKAPVCNIQMLIAEIENDAHDTNQKIYTSLLKSSSDSLSQTLEELADVLEVRRDTTLAYQNCNFRMNFSKVCLQHIAEIQSKNAQLTTDFKVDHIYYPKIYLESIFSNLISNALKYTHTDRQPQIHISTYKLNDKTILQISDNGIGIDLPKFKSQLFMFKKIFHRGFDSRGIGLFITRYQVENLGGKIDVESQPGEGTTFIIQF